MNGLLNKLVVLIALSIGADVAFSQNVYTQGYIRSDGTAVQPYFRTAPDNTVLNNYSTYPNVDP